MPDQQGGPSEQSHSILATLNELYIDLLGSLVPGLFAIILGTALVVVTLSTVYVVIASGAPCPDAGDTSFVQSLMFFKDLAKSVHYEIAGLLLVSAFIVGASFFRQDPKAPDFSSALHIWLSASPDERRKLAVQVEYDPQIPSRTITDRPVWAGWWLGSVLVEFLLTWKRRLRSSARKRGDQDSQSNSAFPLGGSFDVQFPYLHMRCYLAARGLNHLLQFIPWCPCEKSTLNYRTKMLINILKIRIGIQGAHTSREIVRNEAQVRLATSVWHACRLITRLGFTCLVCLIACYFFIAKSHGRIDVWFGPSAFILSVVILSIGMRHQLRNCIHYMRVREVVHVLECAAHHSAANNGSIKSLLGQYTKQAINCSNCPRFR